MIPVASITANLSADLSYNPNIHVQTVEIDRTGSVMTSIATDNFVKWFLSNKSLANSLRIATNAETTMDASKNVGDISLSVVSQSSFNIGDQVIISDGSNSEDTGSGREGERRGTVRTTSAGETCRRDAR